MTVEQVQLHAWAEQLPQVGEVAPALGVAIVDAQRSLLSVGQDVALVETVDDAPHILLIDAQTLFARTVVNGQQGQQTARHVGFEDGSYEAHHGHDVVGPVLAANRRTGVGMAAGRLQTDAQLGVQPQLLAEEVYLREQIAKGPALLAATLGTNKRQHLMQPPRGLCTRRAFCQCPTNII